MEKQIEKYQRIKPLYEDFNERIKNLLQSLIDENNIKYHLIESRTKSIESFKGKILRKDNKYSNPIEEMTDLAGVRIILYYQDDVEKIEEILKKEFIIDEENSIDKGKLLKTNEFGYQSVHYVIKLSDKRSTLIEWKRFSTFKAEVQIRTVLQHSWASISHELEYKKNYEIPSILQRKLFRLASLIELADEEFKYVRDQHNELVDKITQGKSSDSDESIELLEELNLLTLKKYFEESANVEKIAKEALKADFTMNTRKWEDKYLSEIINHCNFLNIKTIPELDKLLGNALSYSYYLFKAQRDEMKTKWSGSSDFFILLIMVYENISNIKNVDFFTKNNWSFEIATRVFNVSKNFKTNK